MDHYRIPYRVTLGWKKKVYLGVTNNSLRNTEISRELHVKFCIRQKKWHPYFIETTTGSSF